MEKKHFISIINKFSSDLYIFIEDNLVSITLMKDTEDEKTFWKKVILITSLLIVRRKLKLIIILTSRC